MRLTFATLGALTKYPCNSSYAFGQKLLESKDVAYKKFGYFHDDNFLANKAFSDLGLTARTAGAFTRHPLAFLMEAADDICYAIVDLEDAYKLRIVSYKDVKKYLTPLAPGIDRGVGDKASHVARLRAKAINTLTKACCKVFEDKLESIELGNYKTSLIKDIPEANLYKCLKDFEIETVYQDERVLQIEFAGYHTIGGLLDMYTDAVVRNLDSQSDRKLLDLFPQDYLEFPDIPKPTKCNRSERKQELIRSLSTYQRLLAVTDYISGMTDSFAIDLYQRLSGIKLPT